MDEDSGPVKYRKQRLDGPEGWTWKETGARGPAWYPPIVEGDVDTGGEHLALCPVDGDRAPGEPVAYAGAGEGDALFFHRLARNAEVDEAVERLNDSCFEEVGDPPLFELAYEFCGKSANKLYLNPMWVYRG